MWEFGYINYGIIHDSISLLCRAGLPGDVQFLSCLNIIPNSVFIVQKSKYESNKERDPNKKTTNILTYVQIIGK